MKVNPKTIQASLYDRHLQPEPVASRRSQPENTNATHGTPVARERHLKAEVHSSQEVLTHAEQTTLEALFGPHQKRTPEFYGSAKVTTAYKGRLLDIKG